MSNEIKEPKEIKYIHFNVMIFLFIACYSDGKLSEEEVEQKEREKKQYILSKIKNFQDAKRIAHQELITSLPNWDNEYELISRKII